MRLRSVRELEKECEVAVAQAREAARTQQALSCVLPDGLEESIPSIAGRVFVSDDQRLVDETGQQVEHCRRFDALASTYSLRRLERPAAGKHREAAQQPPFRWRQELVTPIDCR